MRSGEGGRDVRIPRWVPLLTVLVGIGIAWLGSLLPGAWNPVIKNAGLVIYVMGLSLIFRRLQPNATVKQFDADITNRTASFAEKADVPRAQVYIYTRDDTVRDPVNRATSIYLTQGVVDNLTSAQVDFLIARSMVEARSSPSYGQFFAAFVMLTLFFGSVLMAMAVSGWFALLALFSAGLAVYLYLWGSLLRGIWIDRRAREISGASAEAVKGYLLSLKGVDRPWLLRRRLGALSKAAQTANKL